MDGRPSEAPEFLTLARHSKTPDWGVRVALPHQLQAGRPLDRTVRLLHALLPYLAQLARVIPGVEVALQPHQLLEGSVALNLSLQ